MIRSTTQQPTEDERVGETLRTLRERYGFTVNQLAAEMGISGPALRNIEGGRRFLSEVLLSRACDALGVKPLAIRRPGVEPPPKGRPPKRDDSPRAMLDECTDSADCTAETHIVACPART